MEKLSIDRLVYDGSDPSDCWIVVGVGHSRINMDNVELMKVDTVSEYEAGCQIHEKCLGHLCISPYDMILPIQSLAVNTPVIKNDIYKAARAAFQGPGHYYRTQHKKILADSMKKKTGRLRKGILNCHVDGSLRMVITPQWDLPANVVTVPHYLSDKWTVVRLDELTNKYTARQVKEGDRAIAVRPPSLTLRSVQPVRVAYWKETCIGISPELLKAFDGDYDGDEMHLYPVYSSESIKECDSWTNTYNKTFSLARKIYEESDIPWKGDNLDSFMDSTTMSFQEMKMGAGQPLMAEQTRTTKDHITAFAERFNTEAVSKSFLDESIRGMGDTNAQRLSQPVVGDMSRIARIAASCVLHKEDGSIGLATESGFQHVCFLQRDIRAGNAAVRAISTVCAKSQQVALDSHHAKKKSLPEHDMISGMIVGSDSTLIIIDKRITESQIRSSTKPLWYSKTEYGIYILCKPEKIVSLPKSYILGAYNPIVLSLLDSTKRLEVCTVGVQQLVNYYSLELSEIEVKSLAVLFSFLPEASKSPVTTRDGLKSRKLRWTETTMATHYTGLTKRLERGNIPSSSIDTVSSCLLAGNFRGLS